MFKTAEIDLSKDAVLIIKGGEITQVEKPVTGFGEQVITWQDHKLVHKKVSATERL
ncbi:hypothetical protein JCM19037_3688 [Geomicrobium sp. JCM 19037]|uniref:DUF3954 domain-containing protein n=1 Tax=Geomicrobium sp. JCM 19037 TaxID=1460634 RepID=UPI00045F3367|nr:DUF3954 domain-containing protein [Geomicrobium sp. JCM 19037]GAK05209.1 hypothetical protein JCM19037_3688 [Geomicrobium sp. JCM 19037]